jgi:hypothetical protein
MTTPELEFTSIHITVSQILDETDLNDPHEIAKMVAEMIPESEKHRILVTALAHQVRLVMGRQRNTALANAFIRPPDAPVIGGSIQVSPKPEPRVPSQPAPRNRSRKVEGIRDWWQEMLRKRINVGVGEWVMLGDCGVDELEYAEKMRRDQAEEQIAVAKKYLALRMLLDQNKVKTVKELPPEAAKAVWSE